MTNPRSVVLFEPNFRGHRLSYCRALIGYCAEAGIPAVIATSRDGLESDEFDMNLGPRRKEFTVRDLGTLPNIIEPGYFSWLTRRIREIRREFPDSRLVVLEGDKLLPRLLLSRLALDRNMTVVIMRMPEDLRGARKGGRIDLMKFLLAQLLKVVGIDVVALSPADEKKREYSRGGIRAVPDPIDISGPPQSRRQARDSMGLDPTRFWFGVFGHVTSRKNLDMVASAILESGLAGAGLLIAGKISDEERMRCRVELEALGAAGIPVIFMSGLLTDVELDRSIRAVDVAVMAHSTDGPSGILGKAVAVGTRVVAAGAPVLQRQLSARPNWGVWTPLDASALAVAFGDNAVDTAEVAMADSREFARVLLA